MGQNDQFSCKSALQEARTRPFPQQNPTKPHISCRGAQCAPAVRRAEGKFRRRNLQVPPNERNSALPDCGRTLRAPTIDFAISLGK